MFIMCLFKLIIKQKKTLTPIHFLVTWNLYVNFLKLCKLLCFRKEEAGPAKWKDHGTLKNIVSHHVWPTRKILAF